MKQIKLIEQCNSKCRNIEEVAEQDTYLSINTEQDKFWLSKHSQILWTNLLLLDSVGR